MKKLSVLFVGLLLGMATIAQPVVDNAIIPVAVNLNSILRLNVSSGGNIEFTVNTLTQYSSGVNAGGASDRYNTDFTVASSVDFDVLLYSETDALYGIDDPSRSIALDNVGYSIESTGTGVEGTNYTLEAGGSDPSAVVPLTDNVAHQTVSSVAGAGAGDITQNAFRLRWRLGTTEGGMNGATLLSQSFAPDRYTTNVFLVLQAQ